MFGLLQKEGYYMADFEFRMLGFPYLLDKGKNYEAINSLSKYYAKLKKRDGLIKNPEGMKDFNTANTAIPERESLVKILVFFSNISINSGLWHFFVPSIWNRHSYFGNPYSCMGLLFNFIRVGIEIKSAKIRQ